MTEHEHAQSPDWWWGPMTEGVSGATLMAEDLAWVTRREDKAREAEREAIVAWLRGAPLIPGVPRSFLVIAEAIADAIEAAKHLEGP